MQQINNQIRMLQNQATSLINQAKNLTTISFPELQALQQTISQIDQLMGQAQGIQFRVANLDQQFRRSEEHTSELQSLMRISYAVFCLKKTKHHYRICPHQIYHKTP